MMLRKFRFETCSTPDRRAQMETDAVGLLLGLGNPLLDISPDVPTPVSESYAVTPGSPIPAEVRHMPLYPGLAGNSKVQAQPLGSWVVVLATVRPQASYIAASRSSDDASAFNGPALPLNPSRLSQNWPSGAETLGRTRFTTTVADDVTVNKGLRKSVLPAMVGCCDGDVS